MKQGWIITAAWMVSVAQAQPPVKETSGFHHPESVIQSGNKLFVSDIGAAMEPTAKDGDGYIGVIDLTTGKLIDPHFLPAEGEGTLNAPKGMAIDGNTLYVTDVDRIVAFDVVSRRKVTEIAIAGTGFLNDLVLGKGKLYASATDNGKIYAVDLKSFQYEALAVDSIAGANGLFYVDSRLYCVSIGNWSHPDGRVCVIDPGTGSMEKLGDYQGLLDGVALVGHTLYFSDWGKDQKGVLLAMDLATYKVRVLSSGIAGPADFSVSKDGKYFIVPEMLQGKVLYRKLSVRSMDGG